ncbi:hypothetical protein BV501_15640 [Erwinia sp. OAMSP11]|nr:hypothetical protein BV501_15640 [Erwinia sp. OAMSP11]
MLSDIIDAPDDLILFNILILNLFLIKVSFATSRVKAASALVCRMFSVANAHGYPQEWWITGDNARSICCA